MFETPIFRRFKSKQHRFERLRLSQPQARLTSRLSIIVGAKRLLVLSLFIMLMLVMVRPADAALEKNELAAVLSVVNSFLLDEQIGGFELELNELETRVIHIRDSVTATFAQQGQDIEFCFVVSGRQNLPAGLLNIVINGTELSTTSQTTLGENCYTIPAALQRQQNTVTFSVPDGEYVRLTNTGIEPASQTRLTLPSLTRSGWSEKAVRKVLKIFAFGGHATDAQIQDWANTSPRIAIAEMLNFSQHNRKLSPVSASERYAQTAFQYGEFTDFVQNFLSNPASDIPISVGSRENLAIGEYRFEDSLNYMITMRGLNPFRQMVGFWETNYHLAVNLDSNVNDAEMAEFYDVIMRAHESGVPYQQVLAAAAKAAAPASQYGHENSEWRDGTCFCTDDFGREFHQLYFGIFGEGDQEHHENVTIPNTAAMLSGMRTFIKVPDPRFPDRFPDRFRREYQNHVVPDLSIHHLEPLNILRQTVTGLGPFEKIDSAVEFSIEHPDSLKNLPIMIISGIADDNLSEASKNQLRAAWASMGSNKQFLEFIHAYATSDLFHGPEQLKYMSSFWRAFYTANKFNQSNTEALIANRVGYRVNNVLDDDRVQVFTPTHNVFGGQTSLEAADASTIFEENYNRSADHSYRWSNADECDDCDQGNAWRQEWGNVIPTVDGVHRADRVAAWLWNHVVGSLDNYTALERAHLLSILGAHTQRNPFDLSLLMCIRDERIADGQSPNNLSELVRFSFRYCRHNGGYSARELVALNRIYTVDEITNNGTNTPHIPALINEMSVQNLALLSSDERDRRWANERINFALAYIFATPFVFAVEGE